MLYDPKQEAEEIAKAEARAKLEVELEEQLRFEAEQSGYWLEDIR